MSENSKKGKKDDSKKPVIPTRGAVQRDPNALALFHQGAELAKRLAEVGERNLFATKSVSPKPSTSDQNQDTSVKSEEISEVISVSTADEPSTSDKNQKTSVKSEDISGNTSILRSHSDSSINCSLSQSLNFSTPNSSTDNVTLVEEKLETELIMPTESGSGSANGDSNDGLPNAQQTLNNERMALHSLLRWSSGKVESISARMRLPRRSQ